MAVHRRTFFAFVGEQDFIVPAGVRKRFQEDRLSEAAQKLQRVR